MAKKRIKRSDFIERLTFLSFGTILISDVVYSRELLRLAGNEGPESIGKSPLLKVLSQRPWNIETPAHLLDDRITPADRLFVRNNGIPPDDIDPSEWTLRIDGESVLRPVTLTLDELKRKFKHYSYQLTLECAGNGRNEFNPATPGIQWTTGAVGCPLWTGVRLKDVLNQAGIKADAVYIGYYGMDSHLSGSAKDVISRGVPIVKAMEDESLIAWAINGADLPLMNGYPLRLVFGGWPASTSGKWLERISVRNKVHDGAKMGGQSYRVPCEAVEAGAKVADKDMCIIESMPVKSIITWPKSGAIVKGKKSLEVRGHAWAGDLMVKSVELSADFGSTWKPCRLEEAVNRLAWQHWSGVADLPEKGYYEIWARATDEKGIRQPMLLPDWNPKGYLNNACHRIAVKVA